MNLGLGWERGPDTHPGPPWEQAAAPGMAPKLSILQGAPHRRGHPLSPKAGLGCAAEQGEERAARLPGGAGDLLCREPLTPLRGEFLGSESRHQTSPPGTAYAREDDSKRQGMNTWRAGTKSTGRLRGRGGREEAAGKGSRYKGAPRSPEIARDTKVLVIPQDLLPQCPPGEGRQAATAQTSARGNKYGLQKAPSPTSILHKHTQRLEVLQCLQTATGKLHPEGQKLL